MFRKICAGLVALGLTTQAFAGYHMTPRQAFYYHAHKGNLSALQKLKSMGYQIDLLDNYGNSALCESVYRYDYSAFSMLRQEGANTNHQCVGKISQQIVSQFNQGYANWVNAVNSGQITYVSNKTNRNNTAYGNYYTGNNQQTSLFNTIYGLASDEKKEQLQSLRSRGINLDTTNTVGNTPYCQALIDENCPAYETLKDLKVSTNHFCVKRLSKDQQTLNCDKGALWWWVGGGAVAGTAAIVAIAASGGGGGGGGSDGGSGSGDGNGSGDGDDSGGNDGGGSGTGGASTQCNNNGTYDETLLKCVCNSGYIGNNCEVTSDYCGSHGNYNVPQKNVNVQMISLAMQTLLKAGANPEASCMQKISPFQKELLKSVHNLSLNPSSTAITAIDLGLVVSAAVIGGGVALGVSSGGGGSSSGEADSTEKIPIDCGAHGTPDTEGICRCDEGYDGPRCNLEKICDEKYLTSCALGYHQDTSNSCKSGEKILYMCVQNDCSNYTLTSCPNNMYCTSCQSGNKTTYKKSSCKTGWTGDDCTTPATCSDYNTSCGEGYQKDTTDSCQSGTQILYKCKPNDCSAYSEDCGEGYNKAEACLSGTKQYYSCVPKSCGDGYVPGTSCGSGYIQDEQLCQSGDNFYIKCVEAPCTGYTQSCTTGYHEKAGDTCQSGLKTLVKCEENDCSSFTVSGSCPVNAEGCTSCQSGSKTFYKVTQCKQGWNGTDCSTVNQCGYTTTSCGIGYEESGEICWSAGIQYKHCKPNDCSAYSEDCGEGYNKVEACLSGTKQYYSCVPKSCGDGYVPGTSCGVGYVQEGELCQSGDTSYIKCIENPCTGYSQSCTTGYHEKVGDTCQSGTKTLVKCEENDCSAYPLSSCNEAYMNCSSCMTPAGQKYQKMSCKEGYEGNDCTTPATCSGYNSSCGEGYQVVSGDTCQSGTSTLVKCIENSCEGYTVGNCPENAEDCRECMRGTTQTYQITQCKDGWEGETCSEEKPCHDYPLTTCPSNAECEGTCRSGNTDKFKITKCTNTDYVPSSDGLSCVLHCAANKYASGDTCLNCPTGATSPENSSSINDCVCGSGYKLEGGTCKQVDFVNLEKHPGGIKTAAQFSAESEFIKGNFLNQINAQFAYEHGYNGSITNMDQDGNVLLTENKVKVGVIDNYLDVNNPDITSNLITETVGGTTKAVGINFDYGPCRGDDKTNCYALLKNEEKTNKYGKDVFDIVFYKTETDYQLVFDQSNDSDYSKTNYKATFDTAFKYYSSTYDWDTDTKYNVGTTSNTSFDSESNTSEQDHGTHVTGIIAALSNTSGMQGVVPNSEILFTQAHSVVKGDYFQGKWFESAMQNYADSGVKVINMSIGGGKTSYAGLIGENAYDVYPYYQVKAMEIAAQNNIVTVHSAGNDGNNKEAELDSAYTLTSTFNGSGTYDLTNLNISVTSVDKNDKLASYSQICGSTKSFCIAAPGGDIDRGKTLFKQSQDYISRNNALEEEESALTEYRDAYYNATSDEEKEAARLEYNNRVSAYNNSVAEFNDWVSSETKKVIQEWGIYSTVKTDYTHTKESDGSAYGYMQGTSMAAPVVTGSVALLMSAYPYLTSQQVVEILFRSANKNLEGWGTSLYNEVEGTTVTDTIYENAWEDSFHNKYDLSKIYGHGIVDLKAATGPLGELKTPTSKSVSSKQSLVNTKLALPRVISSDMNKLLSKKVLGLDDYNRPFATSIEGTIKWAYRNPDAFKRDFKSFMSKNKIQTAGIKDKLSFAFSSAKTDRNLMGLGILDMNYRLNDVSDLKFSYRSDILNETEYLDKALTNPFMNMTDSYSLAQSLKYKDLSFSFGATVGKNAFYETDEDKDEEFERSVHAFDTEIAYRPKRSLMFKVIGGVMQEKEALLGMNGSGIFSTDDGRTYFTGAKIEYKPFVPFTLSASYYYGRSAMPNSKGLVRIDNVISDSFAFDARYQPDEKNTLGLQFSSPLRIRKGNAIFNLPVARNLYTDEVYFDEQRVSLKPKSREYDLSVYYMTESDTIDYRGELMMRLNPDHMSGAKTDYRALFGLSWKY